MHQVGVNPHSDVLRIGNSRVQRALIPAPVTWKRSTYDGKPYPVDFGAIKNISRDDQLAMLRIPPQLMGVVPQNAGGVGSIRDASQVWAVNELEPEQARLLQINDWLGEEVVQFKPYEILAVG